MKQLYFLITVFVLSLSAAQAHPEITLSVTFNSFNVTNNNNNVQLSWSTSQEFSNSNFEVQRSFDGHSFTTIALVLGAGDSNTVQQYNFKDKNMTAAIAYYRIKQVDTDKQFEYSAVKNVHAGEITPAASIYKSGNKVNIEFNREIKDPVTVRVINMNGQVIDQQTVQQAAYRLTMNLNNNITGELVVQLNDNAGWNEVKKLVF